MELKDQDRNSSWLKADASVSRLVCHGSMYKVIWDIKEVPKIVPAEELAIQFESHHPIAVGVDMMDALEAYLEAHADDKEPSVVHRFAALLESKQGDIHQLRQAAKDLLRNRYNNSSGGLHWHFSKDKPKPKSTAKAQTAQIVAEETQTKGSAQTGVTEQVPLSNPIAEGQADESSPSHPQVDPSKPPSAARASGIAVGLIHELNALQVQLDACIRHRNQLQFLLFCEWWKDRAEPKSHDADNEEEQKARKENIKQKVDSLVAELTELGDPSPGDKIPATGKIGALMSKIDLLQKHPSLVDQLKSGADFPFFARKDPSVVLIGPQ
jgi:hypothetical protein